MLISMMIQSWTGNQGDSPQTKRPRCAKGREPLLCRGGKQSSDFEDEDDDTSFTPNHTSTRNMT